jgi:hypothetical protein
MKLFLTFFLMSVFSVSAAAQFNFTQVYKNMTFSFPAKSYPGLDLKLPAEIGALIKPTDQLIDVRSNPVLKKLTRDALEKIFKTNLGQRACQSLYESAYQSIFIDFSDRRPRFPQPNLKSCIKALDQFFYRVQPIELDMKKSQFLPEIYFVVSEKSELTSWTGHGVMLIFIESRSSSDETIFRSLAHEIYQYSDRVNLTLFQNRSFAKKVESLGLDLSNPSQICDVESIFLDPVIYLTANQIRAVEFESAVMSELSFSKYVKNSDACIERFRNNLFLDSKRLREVNNQLQSIASGHLLDPKTFEEQKQCRPRVRATDESFLGELEKSLELIERQSPEVRSAICRILLEPDFNFEFDFSRQKNHQGPRTGVGGAD